MLTDRPIHADGDDRHRGRERDGQPQPDRADQRANHLLGDLPTGQCVPEGDRKPHVRRAIDAGVAFLLSRDPAVADYPMGFGNAKPNGSWFKPGFPSGYVADVLQNMEALCELRLRKDPRLVGAVEWLLSKQDGEGHWRNQDAYNGKTWVDFEKQGLPSKWVTLRACRVLKATQG